MLALLAAALLAIVLAAGCGGSSDPPANVTPGDVQRLILVKEATNSLTQLVNLINTANGTLAEYRHGPQGSAATRRLYGGARTGWNNVLVGVNTFTPAEAGAVSGLATTVVAAREQAIGWLNALHGVDPAAGRSAPSSAYAKPQKQSQHVRTLLRGTALTLARMACSLETSHPQLAVPATTHADCAAVNQLTALGVK